MSNSEPGDRSDRTVDMRSLRALAHPLRVSILELLSRHGAQTASSLAERLGESSGATSYHLRQLAKHDFVHEVEGKGTARERWWERRAGPLAIVTRDLATDPASREAARLVTREFEKNRGAALAEFMEHGFDDLPAEWTDAASISAHNLQLSVEEFAEVTRALDEAVNHILEPYRGPGRSDKSRSVQVHLNSFPLIDGTDRPRT